MKNGDNKNTDLMGMLWSNEIIYETKMSSLVAQTVENLSAMQETRVQALGWEDPLEKQMATHSSILSHRIPWTKETSRLQSMGLQSRTQLSN